MFVQMFLCFCFTYPDVKRTNKALQYTDIKCANTQPDLLKKDSLFISWMKSVKRRQRLLFPKQDPITDRLYTTSLLSHI